MSKKTLMTLSILGTAICASNKETTVLANELTDLSVARTTTQTAVTQENLNLRSKASTDGTVLTTIPKGKTVTVLSSVDKNGWYQVQYGSTKGYVSGSYLKLTTTSTTTPSKNSTAQTTERLNLRSKASTSGSILTTIPKGKTVTVLAGPNSNGWYKIQYGNQTGYVSGEYLKVNTSSNSNNSSSSENNSSSNTSTKTGTTTENLNLRSKASTSGSVLITIPKGKTVTILSDKDSNGWYKVQYGSQTGYVSGGYLKVTSSSTSNNSSSSNTSQSGTSNGTTQTPVTSIPVQGETLARLNLRSKASTSGTITLVIPKGKTVTIVADKDANGWYKVSYDGRTGYVSGEYLKVTRYESTELAVLFKGTVTHNDVRIFERNSTQSTVLDYFHSGESVEVVKSSGRGYQIKYKGKYAWIQQAYVSQEALKLPSKIWEGQLLKDSPVYSNTSTSSTVLKNLTLSSKVEVLEETSAWLKIKTGNGFGYIPSSVVRNLSLPTTPSSPIWQGVTTAWLNVRQSPDASGTLIGSLALGESVNVLQEESNGWLLIQYKNTTGYVNGAYVTQVSTDENTQPETPTFTKKTAYVYNLDGLKLNVRPQPSTAQAAIGTLTEGDTVTVVGETGNWLEIEFNNGTGFVSKDYITYTKPGSHPDSNLNFEQTPRLGTVIQGVPNLNVRQQATTQSSKIGVLTSGDEVTIIGRENSFYKIQFNQGVGYVHKDYVGVLAAQTNIPGRVSYLTTDYAYTLSDFAKVQQSHTSGTLSTLMNYLNPNHLMHTDYLLQFLRIDQFRSFNVKGLNTQLKNKGVLHNQAQTFYDASKYYNIDPIFFVSQSIHETNWGTSSLAKGITITEIANENRPIKNAYGQIVDYERIKLSQPVTVYNLFGIGARDHAPRLLGTTYAYKQGWTTIEKAIYGAAEFVSSNYINSSKYEQNTPFKIKYNQLSSNQWHQYATTPWYAYEIGKYMHQFASLYDANQEFLLDIPVYK